MEIQFLEMRSQIESPLAYITKNGDLSLSLVLLAIFIRSFSRKHVKHWDMLLVQAKFSYNNWMSQTIGKCQFDVV
ncbi:hypothetical protein EUGRSUZ_H01714 [Eucalyptus grandis]|uniref:Uncharacterized protein n=2 Tax=Eucalyptus grandis TaxID=71139 RepID=A0ACC3JQA8_EUCGR|nr:hypothetical protein EUGRSUZ_H01714 [Eucalyptus grandis]